MSLTKKLLLALIAGAALGLILGERVAPVKIIADGFVRLLQMTVLPYLTVSLISSLGALNFKEARLLGLRAGAILVLLWGIGLGFAMLFPLVFPSINTGSFFSTTLIEQRPAFSFIDLYIPANPFHSLANNVVPAVVLFSIFTGIALIGVERRQVVLDLLAVAVAALSRVTRFVVGLTPYGIFAVSAVAAGTLDLEQLERIQIYLITYAALALLISFWILPGLVSALTPIPYSEVLGPVRAALITAFMVGDLFIVLPLLIEASKGVLVRRNLADGSKQDLPSVVVPASFNFPHTGKLLSLSFILFAAWFGDSSIPVTQYPRLALTGLLTFFGSLNAAVPFLLDTFRIPADTFQLFLATSVINSHIGTLVAAVHTVTIGLLGSAALLGAVRLHPGRLLRYGLITVALTSATLLGLRTLFSQFLKPDYKGAEIVTNMQLLYPRVPAKVLEEGATAGESRKAASVLEGVRSSGVLRVGFFMNRPPYFYLNAAGEFVGFDMEMAGRLARDLGVQLELVPLKAENMDAAVNHGDVDIVMSGVVVTSLRASSMLFSEPYQEETLAFLVKDHLREQFSSWDGIRALGPIRIGIPNLPYFTSWLNEKLPEARLEPIDLEDSSLVESKRMDVILLSAERGSILTLLVPEYAIIVPQPGTIGVPIAYPVARYDERLRVFMDTWIELQRRNGTIEALYAHWILGKNVEKQKPRWSVIRNVFHWVD
jgi:Na+/H+-dicarboxylate symporter/ABC-type amino acid transport substrate-binding protein